MLTLAWAVAVQAHVHLPSLPALVDPLFRTLYRTYMRRRPDIYW